MNAQGYIDITDRKKDMFINGGFNVYPAEVERVMLEHPGVSQVAVIGVPDSRLGEVGAAFVVRTPTDASDPEILLAWCRKQMANYKAPRFVWIVDTLPMNAANKVLKTELREQAKVLLT
jgi:acyl-CoA synthetase (AMP-forming)/AMP-acid ligase II